MICTSWMKVWWIAYNKKLFDGDLPMPKFHIADIRHYGEYSSNKITLSSNITDLATAKATLLHEMVHQWQDLQGKPIDHGHAFQAWRELILTVTNLEI